MSEDISWCPICGGMSEAGGDSTCSCYDDEDDYGDYLYEIAKEKMLEEKYESLHAHELINRS